LLILKDKSRKVQTMQKKLEGVQLRFLQLLEEIRDVDWDQKSVEDGWTIKQEMVHIVQALRVLPVGIERASKGSKRSILGFIPTGFRNWANGHIIIPLKARSATRESITRDYLEANKVLNRVLDTLSEADWNKGMPYPRKYRTVEQMACRPIEHFEEHEVQIRKILEMGYESGK
jgi:hypothetical protein